MTDTNRLFKFASTNDVSGLRSGLAQGDINVNQYDEKNGSTLLIEAAAQGHCEIVKLLLGTPGIDVNLGSIEPVHDNDYDDRDERRIEFTALHMAAEFERLEVIELLLAAPGIDLNKADSRGRTPLRLAAEWGCVSAVKLLIEAPGIDLNGTSGNGDSPLDVAVRRDRPEVVKVLLAQPAVYEEASSLRGGRGAYLVRLAIPFSEMMELLLSVLDIDANWTDENGNTLLQAAAGAHYGDPVGAVGLLLKLPDIDLNAANRNGQGPWNRGTALAIAARARNIEVMKRLLAIPGIKADANDEDLVSAMGENRESMELLFPALGVMGQQAGPALVSAASRGDSDRVSQLLALPGIDVNYASPANYYQTALQAAALQGCHWVVSLLLSTPGIDVNHTSPVRPTTALHEAAMSGHASVVELLVAVPGIDCDRANSSGNSPLHAAATWGCDKVVELLLAVPGIDVNRGDHEGRTPLHLAAANGHENVVRLLLAAPGIKLDRADESGLIPLQAASECGRTYIVKLLEEAGEGR